MLLEYFLIPIVGAFIGWITNLLAIKLIFWPLHPVTIPFTRITIQGLLPRRRKEMAHLIGVTLEREVLSSESLVRAIVNEQLQEDITAGVGEAVRRKLQARLPFYLPRGLTDGLLNYVTGLARRETAAFLDESLEELARRAGSALRIGELVEERLNSLDLAELERLVIGLSATELRHIEVLGGVLGFIIGLVQVGLMLVSRR